KHVRPVTYPFERARDHLFRMTQPIDSCGVDPIDAGVQCLPDGRNGVSVVLGPPREFPAAPADRPRSEADRGNAQVRVSQLSLVHMSCLCGFCRVSQGLSGRRLSCWHIDTPFRINYSARTTGTSTRCSAKNQT